MKPVLCKRKGMRVMNKPTARKPKRLRGKPRVSNFQQYEIPGLSTGGATSGGGGAIGGIGGGGITKAPMPGRIGEYPPTTGVPTVKRPISYTPGTGTVSRRKR